MLMLFTALLLKTLFFVSSLELHNPCQQKIMNSDGEIKIITRNPCEVVMDTGGYKIKKFILEIKDLLY